MGYYDAATAMVSLLYISTWYVYIFSKLKKGDMYWRALARIFLTRCFNG
jgi:hypothetical protein